MEFAAAALSSVAAGIGAAAGAAGGAGAGIAGAAGTIGAGSLFSGLGLSTVTSILSGGATVASVLAASRAGSEKASSLNLQADDADTDVKINQNAGLQQRTALKKSLILALGDRDAATAASGVDLSFGTPAIARDQEETDANRALDIDQQSEDARTARLLERAASLRKQASEAGAGGLAKAASLAFTGLTSTVRRG